MPTEQVIGRDAELATIREVLDRARSGTVGLVVEGDAGIGKSALLGAAIAEARERGFTVLSSRAVEPAASWSLLTVGDLLDGVAPETIDALPEPQRRALGLALRRIEPDGRPVEQATIAAGLRGVVTGLASERSVLLVVDDVHWLDEASASVLGYLLRRLGDEPVAVLVTRRVPEQARLDIGALLPAAPSGRLRLGPLSLGALRSILEAQLTSPLTRSTLWRVHHASQGNPLFALEICRVLDQAGVPPVDHPLPVPDDVGELIRRRVAELPEPSGRLLLRAALVAGSGGAVPPTALGESDLTRFVGAEQAGIVRLDGGFVRFAHPFYAAAVLTSAPAPTIRHLRAELAGSAATPEERARHLSRAVDEPAASVAADLEEGARAALARGAPLDGAVLFERSWQLTPDDEPAEGLRRGLTAAEAYVHMGESDAAARVLDALEALELEGASGAEVMRLSAQVHFMDGDLASAEADLESALDLDPDAHRCALDLMVVSAQRRDFDSARKWRDGLMSRLDPATEGPICAEVLAAAAMIEFRAGDGIDWDKVERALELEDKDQVPVDNDQPSVTAAYLAYYAHRYDEARERLLAVREDQAARGVDDGFVHTWLGGTELKSGNFREAAAVFDEGITITDLTGNTTIRDQLFALRAAVDAHLGEIDAVRDRLAGTPGAGGVAATGTYALKAALVAALSERDHQEAWRACRTEVEQVEAEGIAEPSQDDWVADAVEAMAGVGLADRASVLIEEWEERARALDYPWALALAARCRALTHAAAGDHAAAITAAEEALEHHAHLGEPFQRARTLLVLGEAQRRVRRRADARRTLGEAFAEFERMGCRVWAERTREELARIGGRPPSERGLSASEQRVAELAAAGASNKEIAAALSVSVHTVESHLSHAFAKLDITRRAQLPGRIAAGPAVGD